MDEETELKRAEFSFRIYLVLYFALIVILFYCILAFAFRYTYELPVASPGVLISDRWSFNFTREWLMWLYLLMFLSGPFMRLSRSRAGAGVHLFVLLILFIWWGLNLAADIIQLVNANLAPNAENFDVTNLATDPRWCCVYGGQPGTALICAINVMINACPAISAAQLRWDWIFVMRFIVNIVIGAFIIYDFFVTWIVYLPVLNRYLRKTNNKSV